MPVVIGILGAAGIAPAAVLRPAARRDDVVVGAVASRRSARAYADQHGIARAHEGDDAYAALLADPGVDLVYNALPPSLHAEWTVAALRAGKHVLCEKPFTMDAAQAEQVVAVAEREDRRAIEAFHDHHHPLSAWVRDLVATGGVGTVEHVEASFTASIPFDPTSIRHDPAVGGGALMDLGCYPVHWVRTVLGAEPTVVAARATPNPLGADLEVEADLTTPDGATVRLHASMVAGVPLASRLSVTGTRGSLRVDNLVFPSRGHSIETVVDGVPRVRTVAGEETYDHQLAAVLEALATGRPLATEGEDTVANMRVIDAVYAAAGMRG